MHPAALTLTPIEGIPLIQPGDHLAEIILSALQTSRITLQNHDILVLAQKIVSKAEGRQVNISTVDPSIKAVVYAAEAEKDPRLVELILQESKEVLRVRPGLMIVEHQLGFICANAGVDRSNVEGDRIVLLPERPDRSAATIKNRIEALSGAAIAVIISDTFGRPWRRGLTDVAIGVAGMAAINDLRGTTDMHGRVLDVSEVAVVDEIAGAADLVMGKSTGIPAAIVRGVHWEPAPGRAADLVRPATEDMFR